MMKKKIIVIGSFILLVCFVLTIKFFLLDNNNELPIVDIVFPQYAGEFNDNIEFEISDNYDIKNKEILKKVYSIDNKDIDKKVKKIIKYYDVSGEKLKQDDIMRYGDNEKNVKKYGDNAIKFSNNVNGDVEVMVDEKRSIAIAKEEIKNLGLMSEGMEYSGIGYDRQTDLSTGEETIVARTVYFSRKLKGIDVKGNSSISVTIVGEGEVQSIYYACGDIGKEYEVDEENIIPVETALEACKNLEGYINMPEESDKVVIENIECVYWEDSAPGSENDAVQPVY